MGRHGRHDELLGGSKLASASRSVRRGQGEKGPIHSHRRGRGVADRQGLLRPIRSTTATTRPRLPTARRKPSRAGRQSSVLLTADYAFGKQSEAGPPGGRQGRRGSVLGDVRVPLGTSDFLSYLLQAQGSGAQVLRPRRYRRRPNANSLKAASEFGLTKTMRPAGLGVLTDVHAVGLDIAQGLVLTHRRGTGTWTTRRAASPPGSSKRQEDADLSQAAIFRDAHLPQCGQGGWLDGLRSPGYRTTEEDEINDDAVRQRRRDPPRRPARARHVHRSGRNARGNRRANGTSTGRKMMKGEDAFGKLADSSCVWSRNRTIRRERHGAEARTTSIRRAQFSPA